MAKTISETRTTLTREELSNLEKTIRWYLDNQEWMENVTSGDYQKYYEEMYK